MIRQLLLNVAIRDDATFENFYAGHNEAIVRYLMAPVENFLYLQGVSGSGLTHLLQAICHQTLSCHYLPLRQESRFSPAILEDIAHVDLLAIDDIEAIAGQTHWEEAIFHAYNQLYAAGKKFIVASHQEVTRLALRLADLKSRLQSMLVLKISPLHETEKMLAIQQRALGRGMVMSQEVVTYIFSHFSRDMNHLLTLLDRLDKASLQEQRRLTIPFVKQLLPG